MAVLPRLRPVPVVASDATLVLPQKELAPLASVVRRLVIALGLLLGVAVFVWLDGDGYRDVNEDGVSFLDALYYSTVSLSTTGYGDITPASDTARLLNVLVITPMRILFLIVLVGTTVEVLTERTRDQIRQSRWRATLRDHTIVVGYGTKGRSAVRALIEDGTDLSQVVAVESDPRHVAEATADGIAVVQGDGTRDEVLARAQLATAARVVVAVPRDDSAVLVTLTVRTGNPTAYVVAAVRESQNAALLKHSGADAVIVSSEAAGRLLGVSVASPATGAVFEDLLVPGEGLELVNRAIAPAEVGSDVRATADLVVAVVREGATLHFCDPGVSPLKAGDQLVVVRGN
ncbi:MAG: potassium channel family protein [Mycobacteriales bacterium]|nr:potassium channel family protein [Mycobacteriales bacterium]